MTESTEAYFGRSPMRNAIWTATHTHTRIHVDVDGVHLFGIMAKANWTSEPKDIYIVHTTRMLHDPTDPCTQHIYLSLSLYLSGYSLRLHLACRITIGIQTLWVRQKKEVTSNAALCCCVCPSACARENWRQKCDSNKDQPWPIHTYFPHTKFYAFIRVCARSHTRFAHFIVCNSAENQLNEIIDS